MHRSLRSGLSSYLLSGQILLALLACCALPALAREARQVTVYAYHLKPPFIVDLQQELGLYYDFSRYLNSKGDAYHFQTQFVPRNRVEQDLERETLDGVLLGVSPPWFHDKQERKYLWTPGFYEDRDEIISLKQTAFTYRGPQSLIGKRLGGVLGFTYFGVDPLVAAGKIDRSNTVGEREVLQMVLKGRVDVGIVSRSTLNYLIAREGWQEQFHLSAKPHDIFTRRVLVPRSHQDVYRYLLPILKGMAKDPQWQALLRQYQ
ncbi:MAG TPA: transporter substrate-binding domain-containing protein [Pseudomonas sp.]|nr:transporter substrate-binding domain-containing protein [Pseudomonas sp.]